MKKRTVALLLALVLCAGCAVGGTVAWLMDTTETITNTFTTSDITITLTETTGTEYKMVPGATIPKNPVIKVAEGSEDCWLFVKLVENNNVDSFLTYSEATGWIEVDGNAGVYYRKVLKTDQEREFSVIANDKLTVNNNVTKEMMNNVGENKPTISVTAYAIQSENLEYGGATTDAAKAVIAWDIVKTNPDSFPNT